jgi:hypothetical protein
MSPASRREFLKMGVGAVAAASFIGARARADESSPVKLSTGEHLFVDEYLVAQQSNVRRVVEQPARRAEPIVTAAEDKCFQPYVSVVRDPDTKRFRLWYNTPVNASQSHFGYMESDDGVDFRRPHRDLADPGGLAVGFGASVIDEGPNFADKPKRYKLGWEHDGLFVAFSPDGFTWTSASDKPVLTGIGDIIAISRDPYRKRYVLTCKVNSSPDDGYKGSTPNAKEGYRRLVGQSTSDDCVHWSPAERIIVADERDEGVTEFYSVGNVIARGGLLIGMLKVLRDDLPYESGTEPHGIGYTCLAWTRDGRTWQRDREPFLPRNPTPGSWDRAMTWGDCLLPVGDEVFCYYGGYARGHKVERFKERQIGFARMKRDRFVVRVADEKGGTLRTPVLTVDGPAMTVNANVTGELRVALLDPSAKPIDGFSANDCTPLRGDSVDHKLQWKRPLSELRGKPAQIEFSLRDARLFAFEVAS